jgi:2,4-dienoyl-CoA reductase-like NADH-dependent reductase (Old Yellow Enzyme family)
VKLPLIYVGGAVSRAGIDEVLGHGFDGVAMARALIREPDFVRRLEKESAQSPCDHCNYCAARIYTTSMSCHHREPPPPRIARFVSAGAVR